MDTVTQQEQTGSIYYPQVSFSFDNDPDPHLRRLKNIKEARKILRPARVPLLPILPWPTLPLARYNEIGKCCVTGIRLDSLGGDAFNRPLLDPDTMTPVEDDRTLFSQFFMDNLTGNPRAFTPLMNVDSGAPLRSSYSPELLQLYWLFSQWKEQEQMETLAEDTNSLWKKKRIKLIPMQRSKKAENRPPLVEQLAPFYDICLQHPNVIHIVEYTNPETNEVDICQIHLDLRRMRNADTAQGSIGHPPSP